jgi:hypothetical protein
MRKIIPAYVLNRNDGFTSVLCHQKERGINSVTFHIGATALRDCTSVGGNRLRALVRPLVGPV